MVGSLNRGIHVEISAKLTCHKRANCANHHTMCVFAAIIIGYDNSQSYICKNGLIDMDNINLYHL